MSGQEPAGPPTPLTPSELAFHIEEYKALRSELLVHLKSSMDVFLYAAIASGGISAWLLTQRADLITGYGYLAWKAATAIPFLVSLLAFTWANIFNSIVAALANYHRTLEKRVAAPGLGWETFLSEGTQAIGARAVPRRQRTRWLALLAADVLLIVVA